MKVYIAASSAPSERVRVDAAFAGCQAGGIEVVGDWRESVDHFGSNPPGAAGAEVARVDVAAIGRADVLWLIVPHKGGCGCFVELGFALAFGDLRGLPIAISSGPVATIFQHLCYKRFDFDLDALRYLVERKDLVSP